MRTTFHEFTLARRHADQLADHFNSIKRLRELEECGGDGAGGLTKKEILNLTRERDKLELVLGGIKEMGGVPELMFVVDTNKEAIAIAEAKTLGIPVVAIVDSCDPDSIDYPIPGNDARALRTYCGLVSKAVIAGIEESSSSAGIDLGAAEEPAAEPALEEAPVEEAPAEEVAEEPAAEEAPAEEGQKSLLRKHLPKKWSRKPLKTKKPIAKLRRN